MGCALLSLKNSFSSNSSTITVGWQYMDDTQNWTFYPREVQNAYKRNRTTYEYTLSNGTVYIIDFQKRKQFHKQHTHRNRIIRYYDPKSSGKAPIKKNSYQGYGSQKNVSFHSNINHTVQEQVQSQPINNTNVWQMHDQKSQSIDISEDQNIAGIIFNQQQNPQWQCYFDEAWNDYKIRDCQLIESAYLRGDNRIQLSIFDRTYEIRLKEVPMRQFNLTSNYGREVRRILTENTDVMKSEPMKDVWHSTEVMCWQWENTDDNVWHFYEPNVSKELEIIYSSNGECGQTSLTMDFGSQTYDIRPFEQLQINCATQWPRKIRRVSPDSSLATVPQKKIKNTMKWQWCDQANGYQWKDFRKMTSIAIENEFAQNKTGIYKYSMGNKSYIIKFNEMKSYNVKHSANAVHVQRVAFNQKNVDPYMNAGTWKGPARKTYGTKIMTLYHVTDANAAKLIWKSRKMIRGSKGMFGGGIYFAESAKSANYKAEHKGFLITCRVLVGVEHVVNDSTGGQFDFVKIQKLKCDSLYAPHGAGSGKSERVVYNWDQICVQNKSKYP